MENYTVDYINVYKKSMIIHGKYTFMSRIFEILEDYNIDSCISSKKENFFTIVILPNKEEKTIELINFMKNIDDVKIIESFAYIELGGHFIEGSNGLANITLDILRKNKINIEFQLMNPSRYSILINPEKIKKAILSFISELDVRDSMITVY